MYMFYGMSPEEYWNGDPNLAVAYRDLHRLKTDEKNNEMWLQGLYIHEAISVSIARQINGDKKVEYSKEPYQIRPLTEKEKEAKKKDEAEKERQKFIRSMNALKDAWNRQNGR